MQEDKTFEVSILTMSSMWEIFRRPRELKYEITVFEESDAFGFAIMDGEKMLFSTGPVKQSLQEIVQFKKTVLEEVLRTVYLEFQDSKSSTSRIFNRDRKAREYFKFLNPQIIAEISCEDGGRCHMAA